MKMRAMRDSGHSRVEKDGSLVEKYYWGEEGRGKGRNDIPSIKQLLYMNTGVGCKGSGKGGGRWC
jgi:hypothetical protein